MSCYCFLCQTGQTQEHRDSFLNLFWPFTLYAEMYFKMLVSVHPFSSKHVWKVGAGKVCVVWPRWNVLEAVGPSRALWEWNVWKLPFALPSQNGAASTCAPESHLGGGMLDSSVYFSGQWLTWKSCPGVWKEVSLSLLQCGKLQRVAKARLKWLWWKVVLKI